MMPIRTLLITLSLALLLLSCGSNEAPSKGELKTFETACDKANDGKRIAVEGYLMLPEEFSGDLSVLLRVNSKPERSEQAVVAANVKIDKEGKAPNSINYLSTSYNDDDLIFRTADGQTLGYQDKVRISGTMYFPSSIAKVEFTCGLSNPLIEKLE